MKSKKIIYTLFSLIFSQAVMINPFYANAAGNPVLMLRVNGEEKYTAQPGETVNLTYEIGGECSWSASGIHFNYDARLSPDGDENGNIYYTTGEAVSEIEKFQVYHRTGTDINTNLPPANSGVPDITPYVLPNQNCIFTTTVSPADSGKSGIVLSINLKIPEDAQTGDEYKCNFWFLSSPQSNDIFTDTQKDKAMQEYAFSNAQNCSIVIGLTPTLKGDANGDYKVTIADAVAIAAFVGNPQNNPISKQAKINCDVHSAGNGIDANDSLAIQQYIAGIITEL